VRAHVARVAVGNVVSVYWELRIDAYMFQYCLVYF